MSKLVIAGDSFCASDAGWPSMLAQLLNKPFVCFGVGGQHWWGAKKFLDSVQLNRDDVLIVVHTNAERIPTDRIEPGKVNFSDPDLAVELDRAVHLYFKHLFNYEFVQWAQMRWIEEVNQLSTRLQVIHLHSFAGTLPINCTGLSVHPDLMSISMQEHDSASKLLNETRWNHLSEFNNQELARQLAALITKKERGVALLDVAAFDYK